MRIKCKNKLVFHLILILFSILTWCIASLMQSARYDRENYNCVDMSYDCAKVFKQMGIPTKIVYGSHYENGNCTSAHCWLKLFDCLEFESTALILCKNSDYYKVYYEYEI